MNKLNTAFVMKGSGVRVPVSAQRQETHNCLIDSMRFLRFINKEEESAFKKNGLSMILIFH